MDNILKAEAQPFLLQPPETGAPRVGFLLIHGFTGSPSNMREMGNYLFSQGFSVLGMRIAGHGSHPLDLSKTNEKDWINSAVNALEELRAITDHMVVAGFSFGGNLAIHLAARFPDRIRSVITLGTPLRLRHQPIVRLKSIVYKTLGVPYVPKTRRHKLMNPVLEDGTYTVWPTQAVGRVLRFMNVVTKEEIRRLRQPLCIIQSPHDDLVPVRSAKMLYNSSPATIKELVWVMNSTHYPLDEDQKLKVYRRIVSFARQSLSENPNVDEFPRT